jgi:hypothetical protein
MAENAVSELLAELKRGAADYYPRRGEVRNVRVVSHAPKRDLCIYEIVVDFAAGSERLAAKVYRAGPGNQRAQNRARQELDNLRLVYGIFQKEKLTGIPRPVGDYTHWGAVVAEKFGGLPLQSIIMKAALLPGYAGQETLAVAARKSGEWLRSFQRATAHPLAMFPADGLLQELEKLCLRCQSEGLEEAAIRTILSGASTMLRRGRRSWPSSAVLNDFTPLNVMVGEQGIGICDYAHMSPRGTAFNDAAQFLAAVEALEKYPFCNRGITREVQKQFLAGYGATAGDQAILQVLKMRALLAMFVEGNGGKESTVRKKVMWATVMKRFIEQSAQRSLAPAA